MSTAPRDDERDVPRELAPVERLRPYRAVRDRARGLSDDFAQEARARRRAAQRDATVSEVWDAMCPPGLIERTSVLGVRRGVLTILVSDAPTRFALDRALKAGLDHELIRACPMTVRKVRVDLAHERRRDER